MAGKSLFLVLSFLFLIYPVSGMTLTISPGNPVAGDEITMSGLASANEVLHPSVTFEKTVSVVNGKYEYRLYGIKIPSGENNFAVTAKNVNNLNVRVKILIWWTKSADAANVTATVSQGNVPSGTYDIIIDGDAASGVSSVPLKITATSKITADAQGNFIYKYSSSGVPPGTFTLSIGGLTRTINLMETPAPVITPVITPAITPVITPPVTSVVIPTEITPTPAITPENTSAPAITPTIPAPAQMSGFEILFAVIALMVLRWIK